MLAVQFPDPTAAGRHYLQVKFVVKKGREGRSQDKNLTSHCSTINSKFNSALTTLYTIAVVLSTLRYFAALNRRGLATLASLNDITCNQQPVFT